MSAATKAKSQTAAPKDGMPSMIAYLTRVLKTPTIGAFWEELAAQARDENWSHEEYLAALLQRQVADRESKGTIMRIRTAHFPSVKTLEDFNLDHLPSLRRDVLAHLATSTFVAKAENVILLGPPGIGKTHLAIGLAIDLYGQQDDDDTSPAVVRCFPYTTDAEIAGNAATGYLTLAQHDATFAADAEREALYALVHRPDGFQRSQVFDQITLAQARFLGGEADSARGEYAGSGPWYC